MKITYTDSGKIELEHFQDAQRKTLETFIKESKYVFGDEVIEITASDIKEASTKFRFVKSSDRRFVLTNLLVKAYFFVGILVAVFGIFYQSVIKIYEEDPTQFGIIVLGITLSLFAVVFNIYVGILNDRHKKIDELNKFLEDSPIVIEKIERKSKAGKIKRS